MYTLLRRAVAPSLRHALPAAPRARTLAAAAAAGAPPKPTIKVTFVLPAGTRVTVDAPVGDSMLEVAHANKIDVEGACGGETACSTCHMIVESEAMFKAMPAMGEAEEDMLDLAVGVKPLSRLGCQVFAAPELDGLTVVLPAEVASQLAR